MPPTSRVSGRTGLNATQATAFRYVEDLLRYDPALRREGTVWVTHDGDPDDPPQPTVTDRPWVMLAPQAEPYGYSGAIQVGNHRLSIPTPVLVAVHTSMAGTRWDDTVNLWDLIVAALLPDDPAAMAARFREFHQNAVTDIELVDPADIAGGGVAEGAFRILTYSQG